MEKRTNKIGSSGSKGSHANCMACPNNKRAKMPGSNTSWMTFQSVNSLLDSSNGSISTSRRCSLNHSFNPMNWSIPRESRSCFLNSLSCSSALSSTSSIIFQSPSYTVSSKIVAITYWRRTKPSSGLNCFRFHPLKNNSAG